MISKETKSNKPGWLRSVVCIALATLGTAYGLWLRMNGLIISEAALLGFTCLFIFVAIVVYVLPQLQELNLKELKLVLREIKDAEKRVYAGLDTVRQLTLGIGDTLMMHSLNAHRLTGPELSELLHEWHARQLLKISRLIEATSQDRQHLMRFFPLYDALDAAVARDQNDSGKEQAIKEALQKIQDQLKREIS